MIIKWQESIDEKYCYFSPREKEGKMDKIAIVVVGYNKYESTLRLLKSLQRADYNNDKVDLIMSIDNSGCDDVENLARHIEWKYGEKKIRTFSERQGLRKHILSCGEFLETYDAVFVLEDDLVVAPDFYKYGKCCMEYYQKDENIEGISLYSTKWNQNANYPFEPYKSDYDVFFMQMAQSLGQIWLKDRYRKFIEWYKENMDFFEKRDERIPDIVYTWGNNSWLKYHIAYCIVKNKYFVYPYYSRTSAFVENGTHFVTDLTRYHSEMTIESNESYKLREFNNSAVCYDAFYENQTLNKYLLNEFGISVEIDLYGSKKNRKKKKYILSTQILPYKIIKAYGLQLRPVELNIYMDIEGEGIYLYDVSESRNITSKEKRKQIVKKWDYFMKERFFRVDEIIPICLQKINNLFLILTRKVWKKN